MQASVMLQFLPESYDFNKFIFYGVSATAWQRANAYAVVAGDCDWPIQ